MKKADDVLNLIVCLAMCIAWGAFERSYGIEILDQVVLAFMFSISIIARIFRRRIGDQGYKGERMKDRTKMLILDMFNSLLQGIMFVIGAIIAFGIFYKIVG